MADRTRFDANTDQHHHFFCSECGLIGDFSCREFDELKAPPEVLSVGEVNTIRVEVKGVCSECRRRRETKD